MVRRSTQRDKRPARSGLTLIELMVAVGIVLVVLGTVLLTRSVATGSKQLATARQQLTLVAEAIHRYADYWPKWKAGSVTVADKGWPDFIPGRLFLEDPAGGPFEHMGGFTDDLTFAVGNGIVRLGTEKLDIVGIGDVLRANICLAYSLTAGSGEGPFVAPDDDVLLKDILDPVLESGFQQLNQISQIASDPLLPRYAGSSSGAKRIQLLVDPWGTPYRYFWVYRDANAYNGYRPVETADLAQPQFRTAVGFVLESAGPDRRFGNVWQLESGISGPNDPDVVDAKDNLTVKP